MKAVKLNGFGGVDKLEYVTDFAKPTRKPGQVLIKTSSVGVNPVDAEVRVCGEVFGVTQQLLPKVIGGDVAGVVEEADNEGSKFKVGDAVAAMSPAFIPQEGLEGTYAEYVVADEEWVARVPVAELPLDKAAGLPLVALTAWQALSAATPKPGQRALILAASGGVGHVAVQLAKHAFELDVVGVCSARNAEFVKGLGADHVLDYTKGDDWTEQWEGPLADIVVDTRGTQGQDIHKALKLLKPNGHLSHIKNVGTPEDLLDKMRADHAAGQGPGVSDTFVEPNGEQLQRVFDLVEAGKLKLTVSESLPLAEAAKAHELIEGGHTRGKIVMTI